MARRGMVLASGSEHDVTRRKFIALLGGAAVAWPRDVHAQPRVGTWRIGFLETSSPSPGRVRLLETLRATLRELGYVEGQNIAFESRFAEEKIDQLPGLAAELVGLKVDVIVTSGTPASLAAKQATGTIPHRHGTTR